MIGTVGHLHTAFHAELQNRKQPKEVTALIPPRETPRARAVVQQGLTILFGTRTFALAA